jgi:[ribosomal protein S5]-alanine N-acetyltransferase
MISKSISFVTDRLIVGEWQLLSVSNKDMAKEVSAILTPRVSQSLPEDWRGEYSEDRAAKWLEDLDQEAAILLVLERPSKSAVGLTILFESDEKQSGRSIRIGYMLSENAWGKGYATELLQGLIGWCRTTDISSIIGGVERDNFASQRVMEKNGFVVLSNTQSRAELLYQLELQ